MGDTNGGKFPRIRYYLQRHRQKSGLKYPKTFNRILLILKKESKEGNTARIKNEKIKARKRCEKYGITNQQVADFLTQKDKKDLIPLRTDA